MSLPMMNPCRTGNETETGNKGKGFVARDCWGGFATNDNFVQPHEGMPTGLEPRMSKTGSEDVRRGYRRCVPPEFPVFRLQPYLLPEYCPFGLGNHQD